MAEEEDDYLDRTMKASNAGASNDPEDSLWDNNDAVESLKMERSVKPNETPEQMAKRLLSEAAPMAASRIIHIALNSQNDNTSLAASKFITDFTFADESQRQAAWEQMLGEFVDDTEIHANSNGR